MPVEIVMPKWGLSMQEGLINQWLKQEGEPVEKGEPVLEVETEKMSNVVEAPAAGTLARILYPAGSTVPVTQVLALITAPGEVLADTLPIAPSIAAANGAAGNGAAESAPAAPAAAPAATPANVPAMPAARRRARELGIDLQHISGSGRNGAITVQDVERAAAAAVKPVRTLEKVGFYSAGLRLDGLLYHPPDLAAGEKRPGVVLCVGYTYLKTMVMPDIARVLTAAGYVAMVFDYRGFGDSEGPRGRLMPDEQIADIRAALTFLAEQPHVDSERLALVGISLGGSHALSVSAIDPRVATVVALEPMGNGERWLRSLRRHWEWQAFQDRLAEDRRQRVLNGTSTHVDPLEIVLPDPESRSFLEQVAGEFPQMHTTLPLESAAALVEYCPEALLPGPRPRPLLIVHGTADQLVPPDEARSLAHHAGAGCRLELLPGISHFNWVLPQNPGFRQVTDLIVEFLGQHMPAVDTQAAL